jgi:fructoselysine-6-P-deglycase FrlB-like protein
VLSDLEFTGLLVIFLTLVMLVASLLLFREWYRADREVNRLRRRVTELEHQASKRPAEPAQATP